MSENLTNKNSSQSEPQVQERQRLQLVLSSTALKIHKDNSPGRPHKSRQESNSKETTNNLHESQDILQEEKEMSKKSLTNEQEAKMTRIPTNQIQEYSQASQNQPSQVQMKIQLQEQKNQQNKRKREHNKVQNLEDQTNTQDFELSDGQYSQKSEEIKKYIQIVGQRENVTVLKKIIQTQNSFKRKNDSFNKIQLEINTTQAISFQNVNDHQKNRISIEQNKRQKAELSTEILKLILKKPDDSNFDLMKTSLHDLIMQKIHQKDSLKNRNAAKESEERKKYHEDVRKQFIGLFEQGIEIDRDIFSQQRIKEGRVGQGQNKKFVFHPTYFVTSQVFNELYNIRRHKRVLTGQYGISKTVSVCLFWYLAKYIDEYRFLPGAKLSEEMINIPKVIYWNITKEKDVKSYDFNQFILSQCPQLANVKLKKNQSITSFYENYFSDKKGFRVTIVIDQFNLAASTARKISQAQKSQKKMSLAQEKSFNQESQFFQKTKYQIQYIRGQIKGTLFLSSMNIQSLVYKKIKIITEEKDIIPIVRSVLYVQRFFKPDSLIQLVDYFLFEVNLRYLKKTKFEKIGPEAENKVKQILFKYVNQEKKYDFFITPCNIRRYLTIKNQSFSQFQELQTLPQCIQKIIKTFQICINNQTVQYSKLLELNFDKKDGEDNMKKLLLMQIYAYLQSCQNYQIEQLKKQKQKNSNSIPISYISIEPILIEKIIDRKIFDYENNEQIIMLLPRLLMIKLLKSYSQTFSSVYICAIIHFLKKLQKGPFQGGVFEKYFILSINTGKTSFQLKQQKKQRGKIIKSDIQKLEQSPVYRFKPLQPSSVQKQKKTQKKSNQQYESLSLLQRFFGPIYKMIERSQKSAVLLPVLQDFLGEQDQYVDITEIRSNSKIIDVAFLKLAYQFDIIEITIWLFDLTVKKQLISSKIEDFMDIFLKFNEKNVLEHTLQGQKIKFNLKYVVLSFKITIQSKIMAEKLNKKFQGKISFEETKGSNYLKVNQLVGSTQCLLQSVGWMNIEEDFKMDSDDSSTKNQIENFKKITKAIIETRQKKK